MANVLFDFDGTLFNTFDGIARCVNCALQKMGKQQLSDDVLRNFLGPPIHSSMRNYANLSESESETAVRLFRQEYEIAGVFESKPYDGIVQLLSELKQSGVQLCVASSKPIDSIYKLLDKHAMREFFVRVCGADKAERGEDKKDLLMNAMIERDAVMVGDRKYDVLAAKELGLRAVGVTYGFGSAEELLSSGADVLADDSAELKRVLFELLRRNRKGL